MSRGLGDVYKRQGNVVAVKHGTCDCRKKIMLTAHADEIGLIITYIDNDGFLYFNEIGGIDTNLLPSKVVSIKGINGLIDGVIGVKPVHLQERGNNKQNLSPEDLWIDINVKDKEEDGTTAEAKQPVDEEADKQEVKETAKQETKQETKQEVQTMEGEFTEDDFYVVKKGDTLDTISLKIYGNTGHVEAICKMNGLSDGNLIFIGQKLLLP